MSSQNERQTAERWAHLRFSIIAHLLAAPPEHGELRTQLEELSKKVWRHPMTGNAIQFSVPTIERWLYIARRAGVDPVGALARRLRKDAGHHRKLGFAHRALIRAQYAQHKGWSYQLHHDNLVALASEQAELGPFPSYAVVRRYMRAQGLRRRRDPGHRQTPGAQAAAKRLEELEVRSYEALHVAGLWHLDFHQGSHRILTLDGEWVTPMLLGILDDRSRLACHLQWYLDETAETLIHGLSQAFLKRELPRALMTDNGSAMKAGETQRGLQRLGIPQEFTLPYSPYQNAKQESFWGQVEGRLLAMLEGVPDLSLELLNEATQAWVEFEYNRKVHDELAATPLSVYLSAENVGRNAPDPDTLRKAFRAETTRKQRRSDGTFSLCGRRYEVPSRFRHIESLRIAYASWDLSWVELLDHQSGEPLCLVLPLDKRANADGHRRHLSPPITQDTSVSPLPEPQKPAGIAPLLAQLMARRTATGLPPAYIPKQPRVMEPAWGITSNPQDQGTSPACAPDPTEKD